MSDFWYLVAIDPVKNVARLQDELLREIEPVPIETALVSVGVDAINSSDKQFIVEFSELKMKHE